MKPEFERTPLHGRVSGHAWGKSHSIALGIAASTAACVLILILVCEVWL